jgi:hypothetical protein
MSASADWPIATLAEIIAKETAATVRRPRELLVIVYRSFAQQSPEFNEFNDMPTATQRLWQAGANRPRNLNCVWQASLLFCYPAAGTRTNSLAIGLAWVVPNKVFKNCPGGEVKRPFFAANGADFDSFQLQRTSIPRQSHCHLAVKKSKMNL